MGKYTKQDIFRMVEEEDVEFIRLQFTDMFGVLKNVAITSSQLGKALDNKCMFDGSSVEGFVRIEESDMYLYPDYDTFEIFPWRPQQGKVARLICDVYTPDGKPFEGDPRWILKKVIKEAEDLCETHDDGMVKNMALAILRHMLVHSDKIIDRERRRISSKYFSPRAQTKILMDRQKSQKERGI